MNVQAIRGVAALAEMLNKIGDPESNDQDVALILTDNETDLRELLNFAAPLLAAES